MLTSMICMSPKRRPERIALRVAKGCLAPADSLSEARLRAKGYAIGDIVFAEIRKPRNPAFHRLAHALGALVADNIDEFCGMDPHAVLKRLQLESGIGCESIAYKINGMAIVQSIPLSLSFESLDEGEFREVFTGMCRHLSKAYWPSATPDEIAAMIDLMPAEAG